MIFCSPDPLDRKASARAGARVHVIATLEAMKAETLLHAPAMGGVGQLADSFRDLGRRNLHLNLEDYH